MKYQFKVEEPGDVEFTLTATMPLSSWVEIRRSIDKPYHPFVKAIDEMVDVATMRIDGVNGGEMR